MDSFSASQTQGCPHTTIMYLDKFTDTTYCICIYFHSFMTFKNEPTISTHFRTFTTINIPKYLAVKMAPVADAALNHHSLTQYVGNKYKRGGSFFLEVLRKIHDSITQLSWTLYLYKTNLLWKLGGGANHTMPHPPHPFEQKRGLHSRETRGEVSS